MLPPEEPSKAQDSGDELLEQAITGLEKALTTPLVDGPRWRLRVALAAEHALGLIEEHVHESEACGAMLEQVGAISPHLARRANQMCVDHERLCSAAIALRQVVDDVDETAIARQAPELRKSALELIGQLSSHREQRSALLDIYRAHVDEVDQPAVA